MKTPMRELLERLILSIVDAVKYGTSDWGSWTDAEQYYTKTFNDNEK